MAEELRKEGDQNKEVVHKEEGKPLKKGDSAALEGGMSLEIMQMLALGYSATSLHSPHSHLLGHGMAYQLALLLEPPHLARERKEREEHQLALMLKPDMKVMDVKETKLVGFARKMF